jgi:hypothetical protein
MTEIRHIALFQRKEIRRTLHEGQWWFVLTDVVGALTDSVNPADYLKKLRKRDPSLTLAFQGGGQFVPPLGLTFPTPGGPQVFQCWHTEGLFRLIQSIPSPKAEPFKRWLARVGYERIQEIEDPELASKRTRDIYKAKGYSNDWIEKRMRSIAIRDELTDEWQKRGVREQREYAILTAEISKASFGLTPSEYARLKGLKRENLRDHMNDLELIFSMLGEAATTEIARNRDAQLSREPGGRTGWGQGGRECAEGFGKEERPQGHYESKLPQPDRSEAGQSERYSAEACFSAQKNQQRQAMMYFPFS